MNPASDDEFTVVTGTNNGIEIRAKLSEKYSCGEFTLNDKPQPIFISPWMQFEPSKMADERLRMAYEIVHRATSYPAALKRVDHLAKQLELSNEYIDRMRRQRDATWDLWRKDREKMGLPTDMSDIKDWPPEMMSGYV